MNLAIGHKVDPVIDHVPGKRLQALKVPSTPADPAEAVLTGVRALVGVKNRPTRLSKPALETLAAEAGLDPIQLQRVFSRWAGITPKQFIQAITLDHARALLREPDLVNKMIADSSVRSRCNHNNRCIRIRINRCRIWCNR